MNYRPLLERDQTTADSWPINHRIFWRDALLVPIIVFSVIGLSFLPAAAATSVTSLAVTQQVNLERTTHGLRPLSTDPVLQAAATAKANDMVKYGYFAHYYHNETPWDFIERAGATDWKVAGENLAKNYDSPVALVQAWMDSRLHRENILRDEYDKTGVAVVNTTLPNGEKVTVTVQLFTGV